MQKHINISTLIEYAACLIFIVGSMVLSFWFQDWGHAVIITGLLLIYVILIYKNLTTTLFSILFIVLILMMILGSGDIWGLYEKYNWYDKPVHFTAELVLTLLASHIISVKKLATFKNKYIFFFVLVSIGLTLGAMWEIVEWFVHFVMPPTDLYTATDTAMDLLIDAWGVLLAGYIAAFSPLFRRGYLSNF